MAQFNFTTEQTNFLLNYTPKDRMFTSSSEMVLIGVMFELTNLKDVQLLNLRNDIVSFYRDRMDEETLFDAKGNFKCRTDKHDDYMCAMQSVVAVIDHVRYNR